MSLGVSVSWEDFLQNPTMINNVDFRFLMSQHKSKIPIFVPELLPPTWYLNSLPIKASLQFAWLGLYFFLSEYIVYYADLGVWETAQEKSRFSAQYSVKQKQPGNQKGGLLSAERKIPRGDSGISPPLSVYSNTLWQTCHSPSTNIHVRFYINRLGPLFNPLDPRWIYGPTENA